ncbi:MAG: PD40 domain-containing protein [Chloroflexi bacterium]|nr:PD40 domain-containing protein [Chloroflexota bacterium]
MASNLDSRPPLGVLAYVDNGDIWIKALPDGESQRLTTAGRNDEPRWSSSGQWLAFRRGSKEVWVMAADGSKSRPLVEATTDKAFAWSPTEDKLAYVTDTKALVLETADGASRATLAAPVDRIAWSPDGKWLAYDRFDVLKQAEIGKPPEVYSSLWRIPADGSGATELLNASRPSVSEILLAGWTRDGSKILYWMNPGFSASILADGVALYAVPAQGGAPVQLGGAVLNHRDFVVPGPNSTDQVAIILGGYRSTWTRKALHILSISTGKDLALTLADQAASSPAWSPDGQRVAYMAMPDEGDLVGGETARQGLMQRRIFVANVQGEPQRQKLTDDPLYRDEYPLWSADGAFILFVRLSGEDRVSLWLVPATDGQPRQIAEQLTPNLGLPPVWFGYYGYVDWERLIDWWRGK